MLTLDSPSVQRVARALHAAGIESEIVELPGAAHTAKLAAQFLGCELGQIANSLVRSLAAYSEIWAAAGHPNTVFRLTYPELVRITGGTEVDVASI